MDKATKKSRVSDLQQILGAVPSVILTDFSGLDVDNITELRRQFRAAGVAYKVIKNTLMGLAIKGTPLEGLTKHLAGPIALAYHVEDDPAAPAKVCLEFAKKNDKFSIRAGWVDGDVLDLDGVKALSTLPNKDQMRAKLLSLFQTPAQRFLSLLTAGQRSFLGVMKARAADLEPKLAGDEAA